MEQLIFRAKRVLNNPPRQNCDFERRKISRIHKTVKFKLVCRGSPDSNGMREQGYVCTDFGRKIYNVQELGSTDPKRTFLKLSSHGFLATPHRLRSHGIGDSPLCAVVALGHSSPPLDLSQAREVRNAAHPECPNAPVPKPLLEASPALQLHSTTPCLPLMPLLVPESHREGVARAESDRRSSGPDHHLASVPASQISPPPSGPRQAPRTTRLGI